MNDIRRITSGDLELAFDQRGHGDSTPVTDPALYSAKLMADDIAAVMDALAIEQAVVGGSSMGAASALLFALKWPERVKAILLAGPAFGDRPNPDRQRVWEGGDLILKQGIEVYLSHAVDLMQTTGLPPDVINHRIQEYRSHDPHIIAVALQMVIDWIILTDLSAVSALACPVGIVAWPGDLLHPLDLAQRLVAAFSYARLEMIPSWRDRFVDPAIVGRAFLRLLESFGECKSEQEDTSAERHAQRI